MENLRKSLKNHIPFATLNANMASRVNHTLANAQSKWELLRSVEVFATEQRALMARKSCSTHSLQELEKDMQACQSFNTEADFGFIKSKIQPHSTQKQIESLRQFTLDKWHKLLESKRAQWRKKLYAAFKKLIIDVLLALIQEPKILKKLAKLLRSQNLAKEHEMQHLMQDSQAGAQKDGQAMGQKGVQAGEQADTEADFDFAHIARAAVEKYRDPEHAQSEILYHLRMQSEKAAGGSKSINIIDTSLALMQNNRDLSAFCDSLGSQDKREQKPISIKSQKLDSRGRERVAGVTLGRDLENVLPQELALLDDKDLAIIFDLKFIENRLMCVEKDALLSIDEQSLQDEIAANKGAIILCIDTSSSMGGEPESVAKAITLYLCLRALKQRRALYLINFSSHIQCIRLYGGGSMARCVRFLRSSFHGGTDVEIALKEGVRVMKQDEFSLSDLLVISDGYFSRLSKNLKQDLDTMRASGNRFLFLEINPYGNASNANKEFCGHYLFKNEKLKTLYARESKSIEAKNIEAKDSKKADSSLETSNNISI